MATLKDSVNLNTTRKKTKDGYLKGTASLSIVGVQKYKESDLTGNPLDTNIVGLYRTKATLSDTDTIESAKYKPFTNLHSDSDVNSTNYNNYSVGLTTDAFFNEDTQTLDAEYVIHHEGMIRNIESNTREENQISLGYDVKFKKESGNYNGIDFDYITTSSMNINHNAIVGRDGRCGVMVSLHDSNKGESMTKEEVRAKIKSDDEFKNSLKDLFVEEVLEPTKEEIEAKEAELEAVKLADAKDFEVKLHDAVETKLEIINKAQKVLKGESLTRLSDREILEKVSPDNKDKSDDYLMAMLDAKVSAAEELEGANASLSDSFKASLNDKNTKQEPARILSAEEIRKLGE